MDELDIIIAQERYRDARREAEKWHSVKESGFTPNQSWWHKLWSFTMQRNQRRPVHREHRSICYQKQTEQ